MSRTTTESADQGAAKTWRQVNYTGVTKTWIPPLITALGYGGNRSMSQHRPPQRHPNQHDARTRPGLTIRGPGLSRGLSTHQARHPGDHPWHAQTESGWHAPPPPQTAPLRVTGSPHGPDGLGGRLGTPAWAASLTDDRLGTWEDDERHQPLCYEIVT
jgi:hypothetical protein